jgi:aldose 1-epimerase
MLLRADTSVTWEKWQIAPDGQAARLYHLVNKRGTQMSVCDWGATLVSFKLAMADGSLRELVLGCDSLDDYLHQQAYLGATLGRYANRIGGARFMIDGEAFCVDANEGENCLHGGSVGFNQRRWKSEVAAGDAPGVRFTLVSEDGDQGFPGRAEIGVTYHLTDHDELAIEFDATVDRPCPINLSNHAYFNLDGTAGDVGMHTLQIEADTYLPVNDQGIPEVGPVSVEGTPFDFRLSKALNAHWRQAVSPSAVKHRGYDHCFVLNHPDDSGFGAQIQSSDGQVVMNVYTTKPAMQLYTGQYLQGTRSRNGLVYQNRDGFCLETQFCPDSPNQAGSEAVILRPGQVYSHRTCYQFYCDQPAE